MNFDNAVKFHGHACPGLAIGYRVANLALQELGVRASDEELVAIVENDSCAIDAIQLVCGCTFGKGNLIFKDFGKQVYTFIRRPNTEAIRIAVKWEPSPEDPEEALRREYLEETEFKVGRLKKITVVTHGYMRYRVTLHCYYCKLLNGNVSPILHAAQEYRWVPPDDLKKYAFPAGHRKLIAEIQDDLLQLTTRNRD